MPAIKHRQRLLGAAAAAVAALALHTAAGAEPVTIKVTANWAYSAWIGAANGSGLTFVGSDSNFTNFETYNTDLPTNSYLYVVAWTDPNDEANAFQASLSNGSSTVRSDLTHWEGVRHVLGSSETPPSAIAVGNVIAGAAWSTNIVAAGSGNAINDPLAQWIWLNSASPTGVADYFVFRTSLGNVNEPPPNNVPEPHSAALALLALGAVRAVRRRGVNAG
jgi:MYXO-CTERM domain-containing protein